MQIEFSACPNEANLSEFRELALSADINPIATITGTRQTPDAKYFIGSGKTLEIQQIIAQTLTEIVLFNHSLSPAQVRNLEKLFNCRVLDRTELILYIFAARAKTFEGKLQVELAQLNHLSTRLIRGWTHLERQKGGIGLRGGPGETQLETDKRLIRKRILTIQKQLEKVRKQRVQIRQKRKRMDYPTLSLVGYTNAGKSTLFNALTKADVYVANKLFATLDPTLRQLDLPFFGRAILTDTVGFIRQLPHDLVEAFHATLEETREADLLLHIIDAHDACRHENIAEVYKVLKQIHATHVPVLQVFNKIDLLEPTKPKIEYDESQKPNRVWISAENHLGLQELRQAIASVLSHHVIHISLRLKPTEAALRAKLYDYHTVLQEGTAPNGDSLLEIQLPKSLYDRLLRIKT